MKIKLIRIILVAIVLFIPVNGLTNGTSSYLILQDIGGYKFITQSKNPLTKKIIQTPGYRMWNHPGIVAGAGHFALDHVDTRYETYYEIDVTDLGIEVQVTQHAGADSDRWLLHELDVEFRNYYGMPGYYIKTINGNTVYVYGAGGRDYRWLSANKVIMIEYHDSQLTKPEPLEVIQAYLTKHPSTLPTITMNELNSAANKTIWIKDEMDRRLWLGGKWMGQIKTAGDLDKLRTVVKNLNIFLDYREKYYGIEVGAEKKTLFTAQQSKNKAVIEEKLNDYYKWWNENKDKAINL